MNEIHFRSTTKFFKITFDVLGNSCAIEGDEKKSKNLIEEPRS